MPSHVDLYTDFEMTLVTQMHWPEEARETYGIRFVKSDFDDLLAQSGGEMTLSL